MLFIITITKVDRSHFCEYWLILLSSMENKSIIPSSMFTVFFPLQNVTTLL